MGTTHHMTGEVYGEPLAAGRVGARVRVPLTGTPDPHWSRAFTAYLTRELTGHGHVGHMRLHDVVQGRELMLDGVEADEAATLGACLERAVEAANGACKTDEAPHPTNISREEAEAIAGRIEISSAATAPAG